MSSSYERSRWREFVRTRATILTLLAVVVTIILTLYSVVLFGVTSHAHPTGSVTGVRTLITEDLRLQGVAPRDVTIEASLSSVNNLWALFVLTPTPSAPKSLELTYGFMEFRAHRWQLIDSGTSHVGCATRRHPAKVPLTILRGFGMSCTTR